MNKHFFQTPLTWLGLFAILFVVGCGPEEPIDGEEEIDTVRVIINGQTYEWTEGATTDPTITLDANTTYAVEVQFWNVAENENVTEEVGLNHKHNFTDFDVVAFGPVAKKVSASFDLYWNNQWAYPGEALLQNYKDQELFPELLEEIQGRRHFVRTIFNELFSVDEGSSVQSAFDQDHYQTLWLQVST